MLDKHQAMFELVDLLHDHLAEDDSINDLILEYGSPFDFHSNGDDAGITFRSQWMIDTVDGPDGDKEEWLEHIKERLIQEARIIQACLNTIDKVLEK